MRVYDCFLIGFGLLVFFFALRWSGSPNHQGTKNTKRSSNLGALGVFVVLIFFAISAMAEGTNTVATPGILDPGEVDLHANWFDGLVLVVAPLLIWFARFFAPKIPKPVLPLACAVAGILLDQIGKWTGLSEGNPLLGALCGAAGVGLREFINKTGVTQNLPSPKTVSALLLCGLLSALALTQVSCGVLAPGGAYQGDKTLYTADQTIVGAYDALHAFVIWERENRSALTNTPEVTKSADVIRVNAKRWVDSAIAFRDIYAAQPTGENRNNLNLAIAVLRTALRESAGYIAAHAKKAAEISPPSEQVTKILKAFTYEREFAVADHSEQALSCASREVKYVPVRLPLFPWCRGVLVVQPSFI